MSIAWLKAIVQAWGPAAELAGRPVPDTLFVDRLVDLEPPSVVAVNPSRSQWESAGVTLLALERRAYPDTPEGTEAFEAAIHIGLEAVGDWIGRQSPQVFADLRLEQFKADLFIEGWIDSNQFDVKLPVNLIRACARLWLPITVYTND